MLSSVTDDKPSASTWLDRLRSSRGISSSHDEDSSGAPLSLDEFLRLNHHTEVTGDAGTSCASDSPPSAPITSDPELTGSPLESAPGEWYGVMSDVLSELFNFGGSSRSSTISGKKFPRKQSNPRHCSVETSTNVPFLNQKRDVSCIPSVREFATSTHTSYNKKPTAETKERRKIVTEADNVDEEDKGDKDLVGFSRSEVTVIDTSFKIWKSEKLVFRRKNVWTVREKTGKSRIVTSKKKKKKKKKRKCDIGDDEIAKKSKKMKISRAAPLPDNTPQRHIEDVHDDPKSSNGSRVLLSRLPSKPRKEGSPGLHTGKKNREPEA